MSFGVIGAEGVSDPNGGCSLHHLYSVVNTQLVCLLLPPLHYYYYRRGLLVLAHMRLPGASRVIVLIVRTLQAAKHHSLHLHARNRQD